MILIGASALGLAGCGQTQGTFSPVPVPSSVAPSSVAPSSAEPSASTSSSTPSATASATATATASATTKVVKATGSMKLYFEVSTALTGTCSTSAANTTITLADKKNDYFKTVDLTVVLDATAKSVTSFKASLGADGEEITRELAYSAASPVKGTSATLTASGKSYKVSGKAQSTENDDGAKSKSLIPYSISVKCAG